MGELVKSGVLLILDVRGVGSELWPVIADEDVRIAVDSKYTLQVSDDGP